MSNNDKYVFCPHCKAPYKAKRTSGVGKADLIKLLLILIPATVLGSGIFGIKFVLVLVPVLIIFEYAYRMSARLSIVCPYCGFDILLYKKDTCRMKDRIIDIKENRDKKLRDMISLGLE
jgi:hypothetical protein